LSRRLIVNADDLGLSDGVNRGIARAHREGIVTSASLMVRAPAAASAAALVRTLPRIAVGLHVDLGEWVFRDGGWRIRYQVVDTRDRDAVAAETASQLEAFRALLGTDPTHLDSHQHVHRDEPVRSILLAHGERLGVPVRHFGTARYCGAFYGRGRAMAPLADAITPPALARLIRDLPAGVTELCCHPSAAPIPPGDYAAERLLELETLCAPAVAAAVAAAGITLCSFAV
jgi:chitin disaccharide deacetylase